MMRAAAERAGAGQGRGGEDVAARLRAMLHQSTDGRTDGEEVAQLPWLLDCCAGQPAPPEQEQEQLSLLALQVLLRWASAGTLVGALADRPTLRPLLHACRTPLLQSACTLLLARCLQPGSSGEEEEEGRARFQVALLRDLRPLLAQPADEPEQRRGLIWARILCEVAPPLALQLLGGQGGHPSGQETGGMMEHLLGTLEYEGEAILHATLQLASAACSRKELRDLFAPWIQVFLELQRRFARAPEHQALHLVCLLVLAKLLPRASLLQLARHQEVGPGLLDSIHQLLLLQPSPSAALGAAPAPAPLEQLHEVVELLLVLSVLAEFKEAILAAPGLVEHMVKAAHQHAPLRYGICQLLSNLARFPDPLTKEQQDLLRLKRMHQAGGGNEPPAEAPGPLEERPCVERRCTRLVELGALRIFTLPPSALGRSPQVQEALARLALDLGTVPPLRGKMVQEGVACCLLAMLAGTQEEVPEGEGGISPTGYMNVAHALAKVAISVNPNLAFKDTAARLVRPLLSLIAAPETGLEEAGGRAGAGPGGAPPGLRQFEGLLALTNLASMPQEEAKTKIEDLGGVGVLEELLVTSTNPLTTTAAMEALCNMVFEPRVFHRFTRAAASGGHSEGSPEPGESAVGKEPHLHPSTIPLLFAHAWSERMEREPLPTARERENELKMTLAATGILAILSQSRAVCMGGRQGELVRLAGWAERAAHPGIRARLEAIRASLLEHGVPVASA